MTFAPMTKKEYMRYLDTCIWVSPIQSEDFSSLYLAIEKNVPSMAFNTYKSGLTVELMLSLFSYDYKDVLDNIVNWIEKNNSGITRISISVADQNDFQYFQNIGHTFHHEATLRKHLKMDGEECDLFILTYYCNLAEETK